MLSELFEGMVGAMTPKKMPILQEHYLQEDQPSKSIITNHKSTKQMNDSKAQIAVLQASADTLCDIATAFSDFGLEKEENILCTLSVAFVAKNSNRISDEERANAQSIIDKCNDLLEGSGLREWCSTFEEKDKDENIPQKNEPVLGTEETIHL